MPTRLLLLSGLVVLGAATGPAVEAAAEVTWFELLSRETAALGGRSFGERGQAEKITARATIALDPADPHNAVIVDLDRASRNAPGRAEATTEDVILRPVWLNGTLLFEIPNRGRKLLTGWTRDTDPVPAIRLERVEDAGNAFLLLDQGFTLAWGGWQHDLPESPNLLRIDLPVAAASPVRRAKNGASPMLRVQSVPG